MKRALRGLLIAGLSAATLFSLSSAAAQQQTNPHVEIVVAQLAERVPLMAQNGYPNYELIGANAINNGTSQTINYTSNDGQDVVLVGVCDGDCSDIDLRVRSGGRVIGEDVLADDVPVVQVQPGGRPLSIEVIMAACSVDPCYYGVAVFRH
jgi:hypothetical protein